MYCVICSVAMYILPDHHPLHGSLVILTSSNSVVADAALVKLPQSQHGSQELFHITGGVNHLIISPAFRYCVLKFNWTLKTNRWQLTGCSFHNVAYFLTYIQHSYRSFFSFPFLHIICSLISKSYIILDTLGNQCFMEIYFGQLWVFYL